MFVVVRRRLRWVKGTLLGLGNASRKFGKYKWTASLLAFKVYSPTSGATGVQDQSYIIGDGITRITVRLDLASLALIGNPVLESIVLDPELHGANALFLRGIQRNMSSIILRGEFWKDEDGWLGVRQVKLEFWNRVCRVERCSDRSESRRRY
jgi:hypothetical protein